jgi:hypothetical protein
MSGQKPKSLEELGYKLLDPSLSESNYCQPYFKTFRQCHGFTGRSKQYYTYGKKMSCSREGDMLSTCLKMKLSTKYEDKVNYYDGFHERNPPHVNKLWSIRESPPSDFECYKDTSPSQKREIFESIMGGGVQEEEKVVWVNA